MTRLVGAELSACGVLSRNYVQGSSEEAQPLPPPKLLCSSGHFVFLQMHTPSVRQPLTAQIFTGWLLVLFFMLGMKPTVLYVLGKYDARPRSPQTKVAFNFFRAPWLWLGLQARITKTSVFVCFFLCFCFFEIGSYITQLGLELPM